MKLSSLFLFNLSKIIKKVNFKALGEVTLVNKFKQIGASELKKMIVSKWDKHKVRLLPSSNNEDLWTSEKNAGRFLCHGEVITLGRARHANIKYHNGSFVSSNNIIITSKDNNISCKYLFHFISAHHQNFYTSTSTYPKMDINKFKSFIIPIPPLNVQKDIVKVLDILTDLQKELELQLKSELNARKKQYEYYREKLLSVQNLKDLINKNRRGGGRLLFKIQKFRWLLWIWTGKSYYEKSSDSRKYTCGSLWENTPILS